MNKWVLPGVGGVIAAVVIVGVVLMMGGSDSGRRRTRPVKAASTAQAKQVLPPDKGRSTSEDLAATIANLNKSQLNVAALTSSGKPVSPQGARQGPHRRLRQRHARGGALEHHGRRLRRPRATTPRLHQGCSPDVSAVRSDCQTAYAQVIDAQNLRQQVAAGTVDAARDYANDQRLRRADVEH